MPRTAAPRVLARNGARWLADLRAVLSDPAAPRARVEQVRNKYRHGEIKDALVAMFHGKCAYCESKMTHITYGAIEHFRPKGDSRYAHLTFDWSNMLLSCPICNDAGHKGTNFPLDARGNPLLIDPTDGVTDPARHLRFDWDSVAGLASVYGRDVRGREVERVFDLNGVRGRKELIRHRSSYVRRLLVVQEFARMGDVQAQALVQEACQPSAEFNAFARTLLACP